MKRKAVFVMLALGISAMAQAQAWGHHGWGGWGMQPPAAEAVTLNGSLVIAQGSIAIKDGDTTYLVAGLARFVGFIDGLKEGAQVKIEGKAVTSPQDSKIKLLRPAKMTLNGKEYDLDRPDSPSAGQMQMQMRRQPGPDFPHNGRRRKY